MALRAFPWVAQRSEGSGIAGVTLDLERGPRTRNHGNCATTKTPPSEGPLIALPKSCRTAGRSGRHTPGRGSSAKRFGMPAEGAQRISTRWVLGPSGPGAARFVHDRISGRLAPARGTVDRIPSLRGHAGGAAQRPRHHGPTRLSGSRIARWSRPPQRMIAIVLQRHMPGRLTCSSPRRSVAASNSVG